MTTLGYDDAGRNVSKQLHNGTAASMTYDAAGRQTQVVHLDATSATLSSFAYDFDNLGRRTSVADHGGQYSNWAYGCTGQLGGDFYFTAAGGWATLTLSQWTLLTAADWEMLPAEGSAAAYARVAVYDPTGNRLTLTDPDTGAVTTNTYDAANRLLTSTDANGTTTYTYDANGNQLTIEEPGGDVTTNVWDGENRLVAVEHPDFTVTSYAYNADGLKVEKDDGTEITHFLYDGNNLLRELDDLGTVEAEFNYVPQPYAHLVSQQRNGDSSFYHFDGTRNTAALSDAAGVTTDEYSFDAWGKLRSSTGSTPNAHTYKGELLAYYGDPHTGPEESIYSLHHRDYVAQQGRLRSEDPAADDLNLYRYSGNDPINRVDPSGLGELEYITDYENSRGRTGVYWDIDGRPWQLTVRQLADYNGALRRSYDSSDSFWTAFWGWASWYDDLETVQSSIINDARQTRISIDAGQRGGYREIVPELALQKNRNAASAEFRAVRTERLLQTANVATAPSDVSGLTAIGRRAIVGSVKTLTTRAARREALLAAREVADEATVARAAASTTGELVIRPANPARGVVQYADPIGPGIGRSNYRTMAEFDAAVGDKYQQLVDQGYADTMNLVSQGLVKNDAMVIGSRVDSIARTGMRRWLANAEGIQEGPGRIIQINRRLYDPSSTGAYRIPDVYVPGARSVYDATIAEKTILFPQTIDFRAFSGGGNVTIIRPSTLVTSGAQGSYGLYFP